MQSMFNLATAVGPAIAGLAYATLGPAWCFTINGISYLAVIIALAMMHFKPFVAPKRTQSTFSDVKEGLSYVLHNKTIMILIGMLGVTSLFGMSYATLIPAWAVDVLKGDATTNGWLQSVRGIGALVASLIIASLGTSCQTWSDADHRLVPFPGFADRFLIHPLNSIGTNRSAGGWLGFYDLHQPGQ